MKKQVFGTAAMSAVASVVATSAFAHHPLNGMPMETFTHGVLSGVGHPVLGFDHLFFVIVVGVAALFTGQALKAPLAYIGAMIVGCLLMTFGVGLPAKELVIAVSLLVVGGVVLSGRQIGAGPLLALFALFGLFHGSAFGDSIVGQEGGVGGSVMAGYLLGLAVIQYLIAIAAGFVVGKVMGAAEVTAPAARISGAMVAGIGLFLVMEAAEGPLLSAIGLGGA